MNRRDENRYIDILVDALRRRGHRVVPWRKQLSFQTAEVFHVHWPELIADIGLRRGQWLRGLWILLQFRWTLARIKRHGGRVIWTAHNLIPHNPQAAKSRLYGWALADFLEQVDTVISMTEAAIPLIRACHPVLHARRIVIARHPHYRDFLPRSLGDIEILAGEIGLPRGKRVLACIGGMRPSKRVDLLVKAFSEMPVGEWHLLLAGSASTEEIERFRKGLAGRTDFTLLPRVLTVREIPQLHALADAVIFPASDYLNSGTLYTAWSFDRPVIAQDSAVHRELQGLVGPAWLQLFTGDLTGDRLASALRLLPPPVPGQQCPLDAFDPLVCADAHLAAYQG